MQSIEIVRTRRGRRLCWWLSRKTTIPPLEVGMPAMGESLSPKVRQNDIWLRELLLYRIAALLY